MKNVFLHLVKAVVFILCFAASMTLSYIVVDYVFPVDCEPFADLFGWIILSAGLIGLTCICCNDAINRMFNH
jgi:hypothetical protein